MPDEGSREMASWDTDPAWMQARIDATKAFCEFLDDPGNSGKRQACEEDSDEAKHLFAQLGHFYLEGDANIPAGYNPIPDSTLFKVYELNPGQNRDDIVTIVLPAQGQVPTGSQFVARDFYRCTYWPY